MYKEFLDSKTNVYFGSGKDTKYLTKFSSSNLHLFYINKKYYALTDSRYLLAAREQITIGEVLDYGSQKSWDKIIKAILDSNHKELYFNEQETTIYQFNRMKQVFKDIKLIGANDFYKIRIIKDDQDKNEIREAAKLTDQIFSELLEVIKPGMSEIELKTILKTKIINSKGNVEGFDAIIASGKNSANPHWEGSDKIIQENEFVTLDFGQYYKNMTSDMTRTVFVGKENTPLEEEVYNIVLEAQLLGIKTVKPGIKASEVDKVVRDYITEKGYGDAFNHSTGHGLGYDVHESPSISINSDIILKEDMIITIEPGIYLKDKFGIRIEDDVIVTADGCEILNKSDKNLIKIS